LVDQTLLNLIATAAPALNELIKKLNIDLTKVKKEDLMIILLTQVVQIVNNQTKIINDMHSLLQRVFEDTTILKARTEKR
jgi:uncharacterized protein YfdQ (DUF2303 family)